MRWQSIRSPVDSQLKWKSISSPALIKKKIKFSSYIGEIQSGAVAKSYMTNGFLIYEEIFSHFLIY